MVAKQEFGGKKTSSAAKNEYGGKNMNSATRKTNSAANNAFCWKKRFRRQKTNTISVAKKRCWWQKTNSVAKNWLQKMVSVAKNVSIGRGKTNSVAKERFQCPRAPRIQFYVKMLSQPQRSLAQHSLAETSPVQPRPDQTSPVLPGPAHPTPSSPSSARPSPAKTTFNYVLPSTCRCALHMQCATIVGRHCGMSMCTHAPHSQ